MVTALRRQVWRSARRLRARGLAIGLTSALGFGVHAGGHAAVDSLTRAFDEAQSRGHLADLEVLFDVQPFETLPRLAGLAQIEAVEARLVLPGHVVLPDGRQIAAIVVVTDATTSGAINRIDLLAGLPLDAGAPGDVVIERRMAEYNRCELGDMFDLLIEHRRQRVRVRGVADAPEFLLAPVNPGLLVPARGSLAVVFAPSTSMEAGLGARPVNSLLFAFAPGADAARAQAGVLAALHGRVAIRQTARRDERHGAQMLARDLAAVGVFLPTVAFVFVLATVPMAAFLGRQWIDGERRRIGTAMMLGYGAGRLTLAYLAPLLVITGLALAGMTVCAGLSQRAFAGGYAHALGLLEPTPVWGARHLLAAGLGLTATLGGAVLAAQFGLTRLSPLAALASGPRASGPGTLVRLLTRVRASAPGLGHALRNLARDAASSGATIVAVALGLGLVMALLVCDRSVRQTVEAQIAGVPWDLLVEFREPAPTGIVERAGTLHGVRATRAYARGTAQLEAGARVLPVIVGGMQAAAADALPPRLLAGRALQAGDARAVLVERGIAEALGLTPGTRVFLDGAGGREPVTVVGVRTRALVPRETFVPFEFAQHLLGLSGRVTGMAISTVGDPTSIQRALSAWPEVASVVAREAVAREAEAATDHLRSLIWTAAGFGVVLAVLYVLVSSSQALLRRRDEYVLLRVLGYSDRRVAAGILGEVCLLGLASALAAIPVGLLLGRHLVATLSLRWVALDLVVCWADFAWVLVPMLLLLPLATLPTLRAVLGDPIRGAVHGGPAC